MSSKKDDKEREIAEKKAGKKGKKKRSGIPAIVLLLALIALLLYIFLGNGFGLGDKMGLARGDLILKVNDNDINSVSTFKLLMYIYNKGCKLDILYDRNGKLYHTKDVR